jgi:hypothetical protein
MADLTSFEKHVIDRSLELYVDKMAAELKDLEDQDKQPIFTKEYFELLARDIRLKLKIQKDKLL